MRIDRRSTSLLLLAVTLPGYFRDSRFAGSNPNPHSEQETNALPLDVAYSRMQIRPEIPGFSSNGKWLAYEVYVPPSHGVNGQQGYLPNGLPAYVDGLRLYVLPVDGGTALSLCANNANCWRPSWSPDGRSLAYYSDSGGFPQLWVYEPKQQTSRKLSDVRIKVRPWWIDKPVWRQDSMEIFVPADLNSSFGPSDQEKSRASTIGQLPTVQVFRNAKGNSTVGDYLNDANNERLNRQNISTLVGFDLPTGRMHTIVSADSQLRPSSLKLSPDGQWISYLSVFRTKGESEMQAYYDLRVIRATGGESIPVDTDLEITDRDYFGEPYLWSTDGKHLLYTKGHQLWLSDVGPLGIQKPRLLNGNLGAVNDEPFAFGSDGKAILVSLKPDTEKVHHRLPLETLALVPLDGSQPKLLHAEGTPITWNSTTLWQPIENMIYLVKNDEKGTTQSILQVNVHTGASTVVWTRKGRIIASAAGPKDDSLIVRYENVTTPPEFYRLFIESGRMVRLTEIEPRLARIGVGSVATFETIVPRFDGTLTTVHSSIFLPPGGNDKDRFPTIVSVYGGSAYSAEAAREYGGGQPFSLPIPVFTTRGYAVLVVDCPLGPEGTSGSPIQEMTDVILPQVYHAIELGYTDINRIAIAGQSYGAYGAVAVATQTNLFRAAIALDGVYDLPGDYAHMVPDGTTPKFRWSESGQGRMGTHPWAGLMRYLYNSPYYLADKINTPILLLHGEDDTACPVEESRKMFAALQRLNKTAELEVYQGEGHVPGTWSLPHAVDATRRILDFLDRYVKTK